MALVVLHYTAMPLAGALARLCDPAAEVSAHYLVAADGRVLRLVPEARRAWHAGAGGWAGQGDVNSRSIGIELDNPGDAPFASTQMTALEALLADILARVALRPAAVIGHQDMAAGRKADPGPRLDWRRLARSGLAVWPDPPPVALPAPDAARFAAAARAFGYPQEAAEDAVRAALRARFGPWLAALGGGAAAEQALVEDLARRHPAARG